MSSPPHAHNREQALEAITARSRMAAQVQRAQQRVDVLRRDQAVARQRGDEPAVARLQKEIENSELPLLAGRLHLEQLQHRADELKAAILQEETQIRAENAQMLAQMRARKEAMLPRGYSIPAPRDISRMVAATALTVLVWTALIALLIVRGGFR